MTCSYCHGKGTQLHAETCPRCSGKGVLDVACGNCLGKGWVDAFPMPYVKCPYCDEQGNLHPQCDMCQGNGVIPKEEACPFCGGSGEVIGPQAP